MPYREKYIDLTECDAQHQINRYLANGWYIHDQGLTLLIMRKEVVVTIAE